jgi:hypothetical protein
MLSRAVARSAARAKGMARPIVGARVALAQTPTRAMGGHYKTVKEEFWGDDYPTSDYNPVLWGEEGGKPEGWETPYYLFLVALFGGSTWVYFSAPNGIDHWARVHPRKKPQ